MLETVKEFKYEKLSPEEQLRRGILGRLAGPIADFKHPTRNGRLYTEELWDKTFDQPLMKEKLENKLLLGELGHPENRTEIDMEKIAICLAEKPVKCSDGTVKGVFDILNTPNGRILKTLCDYGCKIGVSSRGSGDVVEDFASGSERVDPNTYEMECWDAVLIPAVKAARPTYVTESLNTKSLRKALNEALDNSKEEERKVMESTLKELDIDIKPEKDDDIEDLKPEKAANDVGVEVVNQLQEALKGKENLESKVQELQEKLSVCYAKEAKYEEDISKYKNTIISLSESAKEAKALKSKVTSLQELLEDKREVFEKVKSNIKVLNEDLKSYDDKTKNLLELLLTKNKEIKNLKESLENNKTAFEERERSLTENLELVKQNAVIKSKHYTEKISKANQLVEHYRKIALNTINKYIEVKAKMIGVSSNEILNRLNENYTFKDIDLICEDLKSYKLNIAKLPFLINENVKVRVTESKKDALKIPSAFDDNVDEDLIRLAEGITQ